jgi:predicted lipoprotein with Yx(FWY)xxD motif
MFSEFDLVGLKTITVAFVVLTALFAVSTGYLVVSPNTVTHVTTQTTTQTTTQAATPQTITQTTTQTITQTVSTSSSSASLALGLAFKPSMGAYLTNSSGWTLYTYAKDVPNNGTSACNGGCAKFWPPFYTSNPQLPRGLNSSSIGTITRTDGTKQSTYNGWPLYYYAPDTQAGQTNGEGVGGVWYAASPALQAAGPMGSSPSDTVGMAYKSPLGLYMTNSSGFTLYIFTKDVPNNGTSACYGSCAQFWPPFYTSNLVVPPGVNASKFSVITRTDGTKQLAYDGQPLYTYAPDKQAGQTNGEGVEGSWYVATVPALVIPNSTAAAAPVQALISPNSITTTISSIPSTIISLTSLMTSATAMIAKMIVTKGAR